MIIRASPRNRLSLPLPFTRAKRTLQKNPGMLFGLVANLVLRDLKGRVKAHPLLTS